MARRGGDDLRGSGSSDAPLKSYEEILDQELAQAEDELNRPARALLMSGAIAGFGVGMSTLLVLLALAHDGGALPEVAATFLGANLYTIGFIIVILARTDIFTEYTTIAMLPVLMGDAPVHALIRLWALVLGSNIIGGMLVAALIAALGPALGGVDGASFAHVAGRLAEHPPWVIVLSAALAGWLMGLLSWLITAARDTISQIFFIWAIVFVMGAVHLHHSVTGSIDIMSAMFAGHGPGVARFGAILGLIVVGNLAGGTAFALSIRYSLVGRAGRRRGQPAAR
jgi:formate-nitrite transporter family protein